MNTPLTCDNNSSAPPDYDDNNPCTHDDVYETGVSNGITWGACSFCEADDFILDEEPYDAS